MPFNYDKTEIKALILVIADTFEEEISFDDACIIITESAGIPPMDYMECLSELIDAEMADVYQTDGKDFILLSEKGVRAARELAEGFRYINIEEIIKNARRLYEKITEGKDYSVSLSEDEDGFKVAFSLRVKGKERFSTVLSFESRAMAESAVRRLGEDPGRFIAYVTEYVGR